MIEIRIGTRRVPQEEILDDPSKFQDLLEPAHSDHREIKCLCSSSAPPLVVRSVKAGYILARWPRSGPLHNKDTCRFHAAAPNSLSPVAGDLRSAFCATDEGLDIKLDFNLAVRNEPIAPRGEPGVGANGGGATTSRASVGLLAMLEYLWEQSSLHKWLGDGTRRNWSTCYSMLVSTAGQGKINGRSMANVLHIMEPFDESKKREIDADLDVFISGLGNNGNVDRRGIIIGEIKSLTPTKKGDRFKITLKNSSIGNIFVSKNIYDNAQKSYKAAIASIGTDNCKVVAIIYIKRLDSGFVDVLGLAAMMTNRVFIPCDSSYEMEMADRLVRDRRRFTKPLRHLDKAPVHPDFILDDVRSSTVIEVWGMAGLQEYETRKQEKIKHYQDTGTECIGWEPAKATIESIKLPSPVTRL
ncbi:DUF1173 family protein [Burkholderia plantarii]|nr:DUF1173 family protein [Burkholderia plantarii]ALK35218.1 hypothetical protein bpln_1p0730 [Burkholderia plantarii]